MKMFQLKQLKRRKLKKNSGLNGNRTHDLCDTSAEHAMYDTKLWYQFFVMWLCLDETNGVILAESSLYSTILFLGEIGIGNSKV